MDTKVQPSIYLFTNSKKRKSTNSYQTTTSSTYGNITNQILVEVFKKLNIKVAFKTDNNIKKILRFRTPEKPEKSECKSGIYKIECNDCDSIYIEQTGRSFSKRFAEHVPGPNQKVLNSIVPNTSSQVSIQAQSYMKILHLYIFVIKVI